MLPINVLANTRISEKFSFFVNAKTKYDCQNEKTIPIASNGFVLLFILSVIGSAIPIPRVPGTVYRTHQKQKNHPTPKTPAQNGF
jgi:hypothetical protein